MKKRRTTLIALTLTAALCLGIGYAAVTTTLDVTGKADVNADEVFANAIDFTGARAQDTVNDTASVNVNDASKASFTAKSLTSVNDFATFEFDVTNSGDYDANIAVTVESVTAGNTDTDTYFTIDTEWKDPAGGANIAGDTGVEIASGATVTVVVTVTLVKTTTTTLSGSFLVELTAGAGN